MSDFVFSPAPPPFVPVLGGGRFPVRRIFCVGRNYAEHAREMGADPEREAPFFFTKPADALVIAGADMPYPAQTTSLHYEVELVAALSGGGEDIEAARALDLVFGYAVGLDMTRRDLQADAKKSGRPWDMAKGFDASAPIGDLVPSARIGHPAHGRLELKVNGAVRQSADVSAMIWSLPETIAFLSRLVRLAPGDLIFTGTPAGVGAVEIGDRMEGSIEGVGSLVTVVAARGRPSA
ncbi:fumarylacetoacetate hydrolase family protein [Lichenihabitans sp. PAMC28606]|uniref:fumarylacetoacetate hydrolase family protein n=1 Tax=Lichenihabitans sp. PAMC28606 TaxID=2880932 RepID=UPI001D09F8EF|nr:fumarylacetoacetate hydrolase family protein [Lichenihabitans sp. PAMC28606]UDL96156.1 fumarylacetoacetate hydrolase family protein [Lichenihabitans sp. PAMC28606]